MKLATFFWFLKQSLILDKRLLSRSDIAFRNRVDFLLKKYQIIIRHTFFRFELGRDNVKVDGQLIYYDTRFGLAGYQGILTRTQQLLDLVNLGEAQVVVDVGSNVGFFSMMALRRFPGAKVVAIEPVPRTFACLQRNLDQQLNTTLINCAVSDRSGKVSMSVDLSNSAISTVVNDGEVFVEARTLDEIMASVGISHIDLLKIDVETFEAHVLSGAEDTLNFTDYLLMEVTVQNNQRYTVPSLLSLLDTARYSFQLVGLRNFSSKGNGEVPILDCLFKRIDR